MEENYDLRLLCRGTDTFVEVTTHDPSYVLTAEDLEIIKAFGERTSKDVRRETKYLLIRGHTIRADMSDSGRHVRVELPNTNKPLIKLRKGAQSGLRVGAQIVRVDEDTEEIIFPTPEDLKRSIILPSAS